MTSSATEALLPARRAGRRSAAGVALAKRTFVDSRIRTAAFAYLFAGLSYATVAGYRSAYPTLHDRLTLAHAFGGNVAARLFYGEPHDLLTAGGFASWRAGGILTIAAAFAGALAAIRALRAEEDEGRAELVLSNPVSRRTAFEVAVGAAAATTLVLGIACFAGLAIGGLPAGGSAYLAIATVAPTPVFVGVGALASQLGPTRRNALMIAAVAIAAALAIRVLADTVSGLDWLRWATPLGWSEELRPFAGAQPGVLVLPLAATAILAAVAGRIALSRDIGTGLLKTPDSRPPRLYLLSSPTALALREARASLVAWVVASGFFGLIVGTVSTTVASAGLSDSVKRQLHKLGPVSINSPTGYIAFTFLFFALALSLFACAQITAARRDEAEQRLETMFALPVSRRRWLAGRLVLAATAAVAIAAITAILTWAGAAAEHAHISVTKMLEAGANTLPTTLLFLGLGALAFAVIPRASAGVAYGFVSLAFVWELFGALLGAPRLLLDVSPFHHIALVPVESLRTGDAIAMLAIALLGALAATELFARRDLVTD